MGVLLFVDEFQSFPAFVNFSQRKRVCQGHFCFQKQGGPSRGVSIGGDTLTDL
ncbi:Uncharacterised protein [Klebsiella pneumoniae]|nr:Uncharacterised protein [Klebsiella pneumoniae]